MFQEIFGIFSTAVFKVIFLAVILFFLIFFSPSTIKAAFSGGPFLATPKSVIRKALKMANLKPGENFYDLGSGTGKALIIAVKEFGARPIGFELSAPLVFFSKINLFFNKAKAAVLQKDFFEADLAAADAIFLFLTPRAFRKLEDKFKKELRSGARVVTYSSPLLFWPPEKVIPASENKKGINLYLYIKK